LKVVEFLRERVIEEWAAVVRLTTACGS